MKCVFSLDDFCYQHKDILLFMEELNEYFNDFKYSLFTVPCFEEKSFNENQEWLRSLPKNIEYITHGFTHVNHEFANLDYETCMDLVCKGVVLMASTGLRLAPGFKAPNWRYNDNLIKVLKKLKFWLAVYTPNHATTQVPCYFWNWDIGQKIPEVEILHAHGHTHRQSGPGAYIGDCIENIKTLPKDTEFYYISETIF